MNKRIVLYSFPFKALRMIFWGNSLVRKVTVGMRDETFLKINYWWHTLQSLNLENPKTYTQKLQWLKANWVDEKVTLCADKYLVGEYVHRTLGTDKILNPIYGVYSNPDDIDISVLPSSFALKANHGSGWNILVKDKNCIDWSKSKRRMKNWLKTNYYYYGREYQYKDITPKIICEKYLENADGTELLDYKFMCFNGEPKMLWVDYDRYKNHVRNFYDLDGNPRWFMSDVPANYNIPFVKPKNYNEMIDIARKLSKDFPHVRVDLYNLDGEIIFGELTFTSWGGCVDYGTPELNNYWGECLDLSVVKKAISEE